MDFKDKIKSYFNFDKKQPKGANLFNKINHQQQLSRVSQDAASFKLALNMAESVEYPNRYLLTQTYQQVVLDGQMQSAMLQRKIRVKSQHFYLVDRNGDINEEKTRLLKQKWFMTALDLALDSIFWGYSLIQFSPIKDSQFLNVEVVPRIYVVPEQHMVKSSVATMDDGVDYTKKPYSNWAVGIGDEKDLGLLMKCAPYIIWKSNALGAWAEFTEIFGSPVRIVKTDVNDEKTRLNAEQMMAEMGVSSWAVLGLDDEFDIIQTNRSDAFQVFDKMIERCNNEISKIVLGQTGTTEEKSYVGSAEVHQEVAEVVGRQDLIDMEFVVNNQFLPLFNNLGFDFGDLEFKFDRNEDLRLMEQAKIDAMFMPHLEYEKEYLEKKYKMKLVGVKKEKNNVEPSN